MSSPTAHPCLICGVPTSTRCAPCAKAGVDLFFCSRAHQKLVWTAHRSVCGPGKAHPVIVPPFEEAEVPDIMAACTQRMPLEEFTMFALHFPELVGATAGPDGMSSVVGIMCDDDSPSTRVRFEAAKISPFVGSHGTPATSLARPEVSDWIALMKRITYQFFECSPSDRAYKHFSVSYLASALENGMSGGYSSTADRFLPDKVKSEFRHRALILAALLKDEPPRQDLWLPAVQTFVDFAWRTFAKPSMEEAVARISSLILIMAPISSLFQITLVQDRAGGIDSFQCSYHVPS